jgi:hypothetical protein
MSWTLEQIQWNQFDPSKVDTRSLMLAKGACLVEYNSEDYVTYLCNVFRDDPTLCEAIRQWGVEERRHGEALAMWAKLADPTYDFEKAFKKFRVLQPIDTVTLESRQGSRAQELVARCLVETGTATYYGALSDAAAEPVIKQICKLIAMDEVHHYGLFFKHLAKYERAENLSRWGRVKTALDRSVEVEDEELALAFAAGNYTDREITRDDFKRYSREMMSLIYDLYQGNHIAKATRMAMNAAGLPSQPWLTNSVAKVLTGLFRMRQHRHNAALQTHH